MEKSVKITLISVGAILLMFFVVLSVFYDFNGQTVSVQGQSQISAMPDLVVVYMNLETQAKTAQEAKDLNTGINDVLNFNLLKEGFDNKKLVTQSYNINPNYNWDNGREVTGYTVNHYLKMELSQDEFDKLGELIDLSVNSGALISYINFELSTEKQAECKSEALKKATEDAKLKGGSLALGLGKKLGRIVSVSSSEYGYYPVRLYETISSDNMEMAKSDAAIINPGEQQITGSVSVVYKLN